MSGLDEYGRPILGGMLSHPVVPPFPPGYHEARSGQWPRVMHEYLKLNPLCVGCGRSAETVHHDKPFHEHPELELEPSNFDAVCVPCHFVLAHFGDWRLIVDNARERLARNLADMACVRKK